MKKRNSFLFYAKGITKICTLELMAYNIYMQFKKKQFAALFVLISLFTLTSGLCYGSLASANMKEDVTFEMHTSAASDCGESKPDSVEVKTIQVEKKIPISDAILPCCEDRHNNVSISQASEIKDRIIFSDISEVPTAEIIVPVVERKIYISSVSPPPKPDILSSVVKIE